MKRILIIGATSAIAQAVARLYAKGNNKLYLVARNEQRLEMLAKDLEIRGATSVNYTYFDANDFTSHKKIIINAVEALNGVDIALLAHGTLPDQLICQDSAEIALEEMNTNCLSYISLLTHLANIFDKQTHGSIAVIGSPAGDRGRQSNYLYGASKAAITVFTQGLRNRLSHRAINVTTIKPGFIDTPMTVNFNKNLLWTTPENIAPIIVKAIDRKRATIYVPWYWRAIMMVIKSIPEPLFKRLKL
jgi:short-subunit dehydrogenase